ncbi:MAG: cell division protein SepF [Ruminococcaceae bacterium]|nr:cell division protein SepF [Oscillospiraceae bacterium]
MGNWKNWGRKEEVANEPEYTNEGGYDENAYVTGDSYGDPAGDALELTVVRPEGFEAATQIADNLLNQRTVVLNLEATSKETARRLLDFLAGVTYSISGKLKRVATNTYVITPSNVGVTGETMKEAPVATPAAPQRSAEEDGFGF